MSALVLLVMSFVIGFLGLGSASNGSRSYGIAAVGLLVLCMIGTFFAGTSQ